MLHEDLHMRKVSKVLTHEHIRGIVFGAAATRNWMSPVIIRDETWIFEYDSETRRKVVYW